MKVKYLLQSDIEHAISNTKSCSEAARFLGVNYSTFKKYANMYRDISGLTLFEKHKNQKGIGISKPKLSIRGYKYKLDDILNNQHPDFPLQFLKRRLLGGGYLREECEVCGFKERRITDLKVPLLLSFKNEFGNYNLENLSLLCYNCYFLTVGNLAGKNKRRELKYL